MKLVSRLSSARHGPILAFALSLVFANTSPHARAHGDLHEQISEVSHALARNPRDIPLLLRRAHLHRLHQEWEAALADCDAAAAAAPDDPAPDLVRGQTLLDAGRNEEATQAFTRFLDRRPDHASARVDRARASAGLGRSLEAAADYDRAIRDATNPDPEWYFDRARLLAAATPPRLTEAVRGLDEGLARLGPLVVLQELAADMEARQGNVDSALARLDACARRSPRPERWLVRRGEVLVEARRFAEARRAFTDAQNAVAQLAPRLRRTQAVGDLERRIETGLRRIRESPRENAPLPDSAPTLGSPQAVLDPAPL